MNKELIEKIIAYNYNEYGAEYGDALVDLKNENEWLHHIIKEVREYIKENTQWYDKELGLVEMEGYETDRIPVIYEYGLLEILNKVD